MDVKSLMLVIFVGLKKLKPVPCKMKKSARKVYDHLKNRDAGTM